MQRISMRVSGGAVAFVLAVSAVSPAVAQTAESPALSGPSVGTTGAARPVSLVERDFDGKLKVLETEPVGAAIAIMTLTPESRAAAEKVLLERSAAWDLFVRDRLKEIAELGAARQAGDRAAAAQSVRQLMRDARPILDKGPLVDQVAEVITASEAAQLRSIVQEYQDAVREAAPQGRAGSARRGRVQQALGERVMTFGQEIKASYERVFGSRQRELQELIARLDLSPEQESQVQRIFTDLAQKTYGKPSREQSARAVFEAYRLLDSGQRERFRQMAGERLGGEVAAAPAAGKNTEPPSNIPAPTPEQMER